LKLILTIVLFCFTLVSAGQAVPVGSAAHHEDGVAAASVQHNVDAANFIKIEESSEVDDDLLPVVTYTSADELRPTPRVPRLRPTESGGMALAATPLYLANRTILI
jgi:hypothetical protein